jgi:hypothetical protein
MIALNETRKIETFGEFGESADFTIENNQKAFRGLVEGLYPDKFSAILKELGANANDSHIKAKNPAQFDITIPTEFDPIFKIRDYGESMSHNFMMREYTKAFYSSKDKENDSSGSLGLGRLSALSLYDSYMATCFQDGYKRDYSVFLNEDGIPRIVFVSQEITNEPNGFLVEIPVSPADAAEFESRISSVYQSYSLKPNFVGRDDLKIENETYIFSGHNWGIKGRHELSVAIMGGYRYPIKSESVMGTNDIQSQLLNSGVVMNFAIGELAIQLNREGLRYNAPTIEAIKNKLNSIIPEIEPIVLNNFDNKNVFEKMSLFNDLLGYNGKLAGISSLVKEMVRKLDIPDRLDMNKHGLELFIFRNEYRRGSYKIKKNNPSHLEYNSRNTIYYSNRKTNLKAKAKKFFGDSANDGKNLVFIYSPGDYAVNNFKTAYDFDLLTLPNADALPFDKTTINPADKEFKTLVFAGTGWRRKGKQAWDEDSLDVDDDIIYVTRDQWKCEEYSNLEFLQDAKNRIKNLTGEDVTIYGLTKRQLKVKKDNWTNFQDYYNEKLQEFQQKEEESISAAKYFVQHYSDFNDVYTTVLAKLKIDSEKEYVKICEEHKTLAAIFEKLDAQIIRESKVKVSDKYQYSYKVLKDKYPLISYLDSYQFSRLTSDVKETLENYINNQ